MGKTQEIGEGFIKCKAFLEGGECYYTLSQCPGCNTEPCMVLIRENDFINSLVKRVHPSDVCDNSLIVTGKD